MNGESMNNRLVVMGVFLVSGILSACSESELKRMSDTDLRMKLNECDYKVQTSSVRDAQTCHNYRRECTRRLEEEGRFVCK